jgi:hypothetical protein
MFKRWVGLWTVCLLMCVLLPVQAGDRVLTINSGADSATWFISGESSLVMNGFDLVTQGIALPTVIDRVSLSVAASVAAPIDLVIYEDANGGSPRDARLLSRTQVTITQAGVFTATLPTPVTVTQRAVWIGFYLPVDFRFLADRSGTSVLTYWAWTPGGTFDLANLSSAQVFGPADGSAPVNINMNGRARITAELVTGGTSAAAAPSQPANAITGDPAVLASLPLCSNLLYDTADEFVTYEDRVNVHCNTVASFQAPPAPAGYQQRGLLYDVYFFKQDGFVANGRLSYALTHCIRPDGADIDRAVVGLAYGSPRQWRILPTARFGDLVCAEVQYGGSLSYFIPF